MPGWPVKVGVAAGDLLPLVLPGHDAAVLDDDGDGDDEVSVSAAPRIGAGGARLVDGDGATLSDYAGAAGNLTDPGPVLNLADYPSIGDVTGLGSPHVLKGGLTVNGAANLLAVNQNLPFNHVAAGLRPDHGRGRPRLPASRPTTSSSSRRLGRAGRRAPGRGARRSSAPASTSSTPTARPAPRPPAGRSSPAAGPQTTPAVGDADGDGDLDVSAVTREGWSFLWDTETPSCDGANDEWWTFHHDEFGSANYGTDAPPAGHRPVVRGAAG